MKNEKMDFICNKAVVYQESHLWSSFETVLGVVNQWLQAAFNNTRLSIKIPTIKTPMIIIPTKLVFWMGLLVFWMCQLVFWYPSLVLWMCQLVFWSFCWYFDWGGKRLFFQLVFWNNSFFQLVFWNDYFFQLVFWKGIVGILISFNGIWFTQWCFVHWSCLFVLIHCSQLKGDPKNSKMETQFCTKRGPSGPWRHKKTDQTSSQAKHHKSSLLWLSWLSPLNTCNL